MLRVDVADSERLLRLCALYGVLYGERLLGNDYATQNCSIARALEVVGERWTLLIVRELLRKPRRFSELERRLSMSKNILSDRLTKLARLRIVASTTIDGSRGWKTYRLTEKGVALFPVINALMAWGDAYYAPDGPPVILLHTCGHRAGHRVICEGCGEPLDPRAVHVTAGPSWKLPESDLP